MLTESSLSVALLVSGIFACISLLYLIKDQLKERKAQYFFLLVLSALVWSLRYIFEIVLESEDLMILSAKLEYIGIPYLSVFWLLFCSANNGGLKKLTYTNLSYALLVIPLLTTAFALTNELHHLIWTKIKFSYIGTNRVLAPEHGLWFWVHVVYTYMLFITGSILMLKNAIYTSSIYRKRAIAIVSAVLIPWASNVMYLSKIATFDITPLAFIAATIILLVTTYRYKLVDIIPIARSEVIESIADGVVVLSNDNRVVDLNRSAEIILKASRKDAIGSEASEVFRDCEGLVNLLRESKLREVCIKKEGEQRYYDIKVFPIKDRAGYTIGKAVTIHDITTVKRAEEYANEQRKKLHEMNEKLEEMVKERTKEIERLLQQKDEFIRLLSHDLKTPLTPLMTLLPMIKERIKDSDSKKLLDIAIRNVNYIKNLVMNTLSLAKLNMPNVKFDIENLNLRDIVEESIADNIYIIKSKNITAENRIEGGIMVKADKIRLKEVFTNLISNAVKFTPAGGKISFYAEPSDKEIKIYVKDTGIGLNEKDKEKIFDEFYKADRSRHSIDSSGLGLSICKKIVEKQGGRIWAESEGIGKGTTICFTLPVGGM